MKRELNYTICVLLLSGCLYLGCNDDIEPEISIEADKITCKFHTGFGDIIVADEEFIMVSANSDVYIFKYNNQKIELIQTVKTNMKSGIQSMSLYNSTLAIGAANDIGTGKVFIYEKLDNNWIKKQELAVGRNEDNFGSDIYFDGDCMVIGASAPWGTWTSSSTNEGRIYIFEKKPDGWIQKHEFLASSSKPNDQFGMTVAIKDDFVVAGSWNSLLHIYKNSGNWALLRTDSISAMKIGHYKDQFIIYTQEPTRRLLSYELMLDGSFKSVTLDFNFEGNEISDHGEILAVKGNHALVDLEYAEKCFLLEFSNGKWDYKTSYTPDPGESCTFYGLEVTDNRIFIGGRDDNKSGYSYVYLKSY